MATYEPGANGGRMSLARHRQRHDQQALHRNLDPAQQLGLLLLELRVADHTGVS